MLTKLSLDIANSIKTNQKSILIKPQNVLLDIDRGK